MKRGNKKGQFYLIAAILLIIVIAGLLVLTNYSRTNSSSDKLQTMKEELKIESSNVLDYIALSQDNQLDNFLQNYSVYASNKNVEIYFIFGNLSKVTARIYKEVDNVYFLGQLLIWSAINGYSQAEVLNPNSLNLTVYNITYDFEFKSGENFYFLMVEEIGDEKHVVKS